MEDFKAEIEKNKEVLLEKVNHLIFELGISEELEVESILLTRKTDKTEAKKRIVCRKIDGKIVCSLE